VEQQGIQLHSELSETKNVSRSKAEEVLSLQTTLHRQQLENQSLQQKINSLLSDKQLLEGEIGGMQAEFTSICSKLDLLEERDLQLRTCKEEIQVLKHSLELKGNEAAKTQLALQALQLD